MKDSVVDLARDPTTVVDDRNSGEFHYSSELRKFAAENPSLRCPAVGTCKSPGLSGLAERQAFVEFRCDSSMVHLFAERTIIKSPLESES